MKTFYIYYLSFFILLPILSHSQVKSKLWYDGNARVMFKRDALSGELKETDTVSTRSNGAGFTIADLGLHFTPISDIEIAAELRIKNDFGGMWGAKSSVDLRNLSAKGVVNNTVSFSVGDIHLKQTPFTLHNFQQDLSEFEPSAFKFYRDYVDYENFYIGDFWRLQGVQANFSYLSYSSIKQIDFDGFTARVRGGEWLGKPELLMVGASGILRFTNNLNLGSHYVNSFEVMSTSNGSVAYHNPVVNTQLSYSGVFNDVPYVVAIDGGWSNRGWDGDSLAPDINGVFANANIKTTKKNTNFKLTVRYVDTDFRSMGAQSRRLNFNSAPETYPYYGNTYQTREVSMLDIVSDPSVYNQSLSTSLMQYNPMYNSTTPYGDATPNRMGMVLEMNNAQLVDFVTAEFKTQFFTEIIGQGTTEKRLFNNTALLSTCAIDQLLNLNNEFQLEGAVRYESVNRSGKEFESVDFSSILLSGSLSYELIPNFKLLSGAKVFYASGNEFFTERNEYDQINDYIAVDFDSKESIFIAGLQYDFKDDIYFTMQYNHFSILDNSSENDEFSMGRLIFMFNINL